MKKKELIDELNAWINYFTEYRNGIETCDVDAVPEGLMSDAAAEMRNAENYFRKCVSFSNDLYFYAFPDEKD
jgi:hypothetical protein